MSCPGETVLADYMADEARVDQATGSHIRGCADCQRSLQRLRESSVEDTYHSGESAIPSDAAPLRVERGTQLGRYTILERIGSGGMGEVYAAYDPQLDRRIALKLLRPDRIRGDVEDARTRLLREAQALARLSHPSVVTVHDVGVLDGEVFVAMEFVDGVTLAEWLRAAPRTTAEIMDVFQRAGEGLAAAHAAGLVHRDFKPANVLVGGDGRVRVLDFGLARTSAQGPRSTAKSVSIDPAQIPEVGTQSISSSPWMTPLTVAGAIVGTPGYMAPEQLRGEVLDPRIDQFSFCVSLYEALYGQRPFQGETLREIAVAMTRGVPAEPPPTSHHVRASVYRALVRGLSVETHARFASMEELLSALRPPRNLAPRRWMLPLSAAAVLAAVIATGFAVTARTEPPCSDSSETLRHAWNDDRRSEIRASLLRTDAAFAQHAAKGAVAAFDVWAEAWRTARHESCLATRVRQIEPESTLALRTACLELQLEDARSLLEVLSRADAQIAQNAVAAIKGLPAPSSCLSAEALTRVKRMPSDAAGRARLEQFRSRLGAVRALLEAGKYAQTIAQVIRLSDDIAEAKEHALEAEALLIEGTAHERMGQYAEAEQALHRAARAAILAGDEQTATAAWTMLVTVVGSGLGEFGRAREWISYAEASLGRMPGDARAQAEFSHRVGVVLMSQEYFAEALQASERALAIHERDIGGDDPQLVHILDNLGFTLSWLGRNEESVKVYERALAVSERLYGPDHPEVAAIRDRFSTVFVEMNRMAEAEQFQKRALAIREATFGPDSPQAGKSLNNLAWLYAEIGRHDEALQAALRTIQINERAYGLRSPWTVDPHNIAGRSARGLGRPREALGYFERARDLAVQVYGTDSARYAEALAGVGICLLETGKAKDAVAPLSEALAIQERRGVVPGEQGRTRFALARALRASRSDPGKVRLLLDEASKNFNSSGAKYAADLAALEAWAGPTSSRL